MSMSKVTILTGEAVPPPNPIITFPYTPDHFQNHAFNAIENSEDVYVSVPTSGGKTTVAKYGVAYAVKILGKRAVYITPVKALSNEKYNEMKEEFADISTMGLMTGDNKINPDAQCILMTAEILRNSLYNLKNTIENENRKLTQDIVESLGIVIIDEVHFANDKERGTVWEEIIILLKDIPIVMLSATVKNPEKYCDWISRCRGTTVNLIKVDKRIIPLRHYIYVYGKMYMFMDEHKRFYEDQLVLAKKRWDKGRDVYREDQDKSVVVPKRTTYIDNTSVINDLVKDMSADGLVNPEQNCLPTIVFSFSKKNCEKFANAVTLNLIDHKERAEIERIYNHYMHKYGDTYNDGIAQVSNLRDLMSRGIAYHHSGVLTVLREIVEILFKKGLIKILYATETFAVGVNTPTRTSVFMELEKYETGIGRRFLTTAEYNQMIGRAGRRGLDAYGTGIIMPFYGFPDIGELRRVVLGELQEITSHLKLNYTFFLKMIQSNRMSLEEFYSRSLLCNEHRIQLFSMQSSIISKREQLDLLNTTISASGQDITQLESLIDLERLANQYIGNFKVNLNKDQQKKLKKLEESVKKNKALVSLRESVSKRNALQLEIKSVEKEINSLQNYMNFLAGQNLKLLELWGYTIDENVTVKGIIASHINECNSIILTEVIVRDYLYGLSPEEVVGLISIFTEPIKSDNIDGIVRKSQGTSSLNEKISYIEQFIDEYKRDETTVMGNTFVDWTLSHSYVDIALSWANGISTQEMTLMLSSFGEYEGQFVKNMTRVYNIINDIGCICKMTGKIDLLPVLESASKLIIRDIVNVNSLYLL